MRILTIGALVSLSALCSSRASAVDVLLNPDRAAGVLYTGSFSDSLGGVVSTRERVFTGEFGAADPTQPNFTDEPGFHALDGAFAAGDSWGFNITDRVYRWNAAARNFDAASPFTITLSYASGVLSATSPTAAGGFSPGFSLLTPGGEIDNHLDIFLDAGASPDADGIYLLRLNVFAPGLNPSDNFWFVLSRGLVGSEGAAAEQYVRDNLVPAPGALAALSLGLLAAACRRR